MKIFPFLREDSFPGEERETRNLSRGEIDETLDDVFEGERADVLISSFERGARVFLHDRLLHDMCRSKD